MAGARVLGAGEYLAMDAACGEYYNIGFTAGDPFLGVIEPGTYTACLRVSDICGYGDFSVSVNGAPLPQSTQPVACADACWEGTVTLAEGDQVAIMNGANMLSAGCASLCLTRVG